MDRVHRQRVVLHPKVRTKAPVILPAVGEEIVAPCPVFSNMNPLIARFSAMLESDIS